MLMVTRKKTAIENHIDDLENTICELKREVKYHKSLIEKIARHVYVGVCSGKKFSLDDLENAPD